MYCLCDGSMRVGFWSVAAGEQQLVLCELDAGLCVSSIMNRAKNRACRPQKQKTNMVPLLFFGTQFATISNLHLASQQPPPHPQPAYPPGYGIDQGVHPEWMPIHRWGSTRAQLIETGLFLIRQVWRSHRDGISLN